MQQELNLLETQHLPRETRGVLEDINEWTTDEKNHDKQDATNGFIRHIPKHGHLNQLLSQRRGFSQKPLAQDMLEN